MKVLVNVERALLTEATSWTPCVAVQLREQPDGSFDLWINAAERVNDAMLARALHAYATCAADPDEQADHDNAMREALTAALEVRP